MFDQIDILIFIHVLAFSAALGGSIYQVFILPLIFQKKSDKKNNIQLIANSMSLFSSINFAMLTTIVFTGILLVFSLYEKISNISSSLYLNAFFIKIVLVTIIFSIAAYQAFHLRFKILTMNIDNKNLPKMFRAMGKCSIINIILITIVIFLGIVMNSLG